MNIYLYLYLYTCMQLTRCAPETHAPSPETAPGSRRSPRLPLLPLEGHAFCAASAAPQPVFWVGKSQKFMLTIRFPLEGQRRAPAVASAALPAVLGSGSIRKLTCGARGIDPVNFWKGKSLLAAASAAFPAIEV